MDLLNKPLARVAIEGDSCQSIEQAQLIEQTQLIECSQVWFGQAIDAAAVDIESTEGSLLVGTRQLTVFSTI